MSLLSVIFLPLDSNDSASVVTFVRLDGAPYWPLLHFIKSADKITIMRIRGRAAYHRPLNLVSLPQLLLGPVNKETRAVSIQGIFKISSTPYMRRTYSIYAVRYTYAPTLIPPIKVIERATVIGIA